MEQQSHAGQGSIARGPASPVLGAQVPVTARTASLLQVEHVSMTLSQLVFTPFIPSPLYHSRKSKLWSCCSTAVCCDFNAFQKQTSTEASSSKCGETSEDIS